MELKSGRGSAYRVASVTPLGLANEIGTLNVSISALQARNLIEAVAFAPVVKLPLNVFVTIQWSKAAPGDRVQIRLLRFVERAYQWFFRRKVALAYVYVHEVGTLGEGNTHLMIHVPESIRRQFQRMIPQWLDSQPRRGFIDVQPAYDAKRLAGYFLKGTNTTVAKGLGILQSSDQGRIRGKRCGTSENIGRKARSRWKESTLPWFSSTS
jgi:hypothetical protein